MSYRRRRSSWTGGAKSVAPSASYALPRPHEGVRRFSVGDFTVDAGRRHSLLFEDYVSSQGPLFDADAPVRRRFHAKPPFRGGSYAAMRILRLAVPRRVRFCVVRRIRRQVLFAFGRAGYSGSAPKRHYSRSANSLWRC